MEMDELRRRRFDSMFHREFFLLGRFRDMEAQWAEVPVFFFPDDFGIFDGGVSVD